jgi:septal ring-binding cell division protein DamX
MPPDQNPISNYFDTPARAERLQLLLYLVRNAGEVIYLRAPAGAGKTLFAQRLFDTLSDQVAAVWVRGSEECDVAAAAVDQLGLPPDSARHWPDAVLEGLDGQDLLLIVDDADRLGLKVVESLDLLHAHGGRLLLVGQGGLAETSGNWDLQFVDLPAFDAEQTTAFLRQQAGEQAARVTDDLAAGLHRASKGLPGPLLDALNGVLGGSGSRSAMRRTAATTSGRTGRPMWHWLAGGTLVLLLAGVLLFQDAFNRMFESDKQVAGRPVAPTVDPEPAASEVRTADATQNTGPDLAPPAAADMAAVVPAVTGPQAPEVVSETPPAVEDAPATEQGRAPEQQADTEEDPLDAVMRDALAAAGAGRSDPLKADAADVDKALPTEARPAEPAAVSQPEDAQAKAEVVPETPLEATPTKDTKPPAEPSAEPSAVVAAAPDPEPEPQSSAVAASGQQTPGEPPAEPAPGPVGAPVESREIPKEPQVVTAKPAVVVPAATAPSGGDAWLKNRDPARYTLQLVGSRDRVAVRKFVRVHAIGEPHAIFERDLKGKPWYSLVAGDYPDRAAAIAARERLPKSLGRSGIWPRTFGSIQNLK